MSDFATFLEAFCMGWNRRGAYEEEFDEGVLAPSIQGEEFMRTVMDAFNATGAERARRMFEGPSYAEQALGVARNLRIDNQRLTADITLDDDLKDDPREDPKYVVPEFDVTDEHGNRKK